MARCGFTAVVVYLDDFLVNGKTKVERLAAFECLLQLLQEARFYHQLAKGGGTH